MDTKFSSAYWRHHQVEVAAPEVKLAGAWMRTNDGLTLFGYAEVTQQRFAFETGLKPEVLPRAMEALPEWFTRTPKGYFIPGFIREQIGTGDALLNNNICKSLVRALVALGDPSVSALVVKHYPELERSIKQIVNDKPLPTPPQGGREERRGEEKSGAELGGGAGEPSGPTPGPAEELRGRMELVGQIMGRRAGNKWTAREIEAFRTSGLEACSDVDFAEQVELMREYYAAKIPRGMDFRRRDLQALLNNWPGELDRARVHQRDNADGVIKR
jgi:hypothetical protein